MKTDRQT